MGTVLTRTRRTRYSPGATTRGASAVAGLVIAASLSATLVKRADTPGVLVAFWRLVIVSAIWNTYVFATGRRVTLGDFRQALVPGIFFGLNLAVFFAGATHNSVANAVLIFALAPFFIVPIGARMFRERLVPSALTFAVLSFGGVILVLYSAPSQGQATTQGNVFGVVSMLLFVAYIVTTRRYRQDMDVATFMAAISPIGAIAVLPLAITNGEMFQISATGWAYTIILALLNGVAAHGLNVYAQNTIPIGTIGIAQIMQPALAVVWAFLLLGELLAWPQLVGIAVVMVGLLAFILIERRANREEDPEFDAEIALGEGQQR